MTYSVSFVPVLILVALLVAGVIAAVAVWRNPALERERAARVTAEERLEELRVDRDYWRQRAELTIDAALMKAGASGPVMRQYHAPKDPASQVLSGMAVGEIDSRARPGPG